MRILYWTNGFWPRIGGVETISIDFIEHMQTRGHEFIVIAQKKDASDLDEEIYRGIKIHRFNFDLVLSAKLHELSLFDKFLADIQNTFKPELLHLNTVWGGSAFAYLLFHKKLTMPVLLTAHDFCHYGDKQYPFSNKIFNSVDQVACVSNSVLQFLRETYPVINNKSTRIYNGLSLPALTPTPLGFHPPTILCIGRLEVEKGFHIVLNSLAKLRNEFPELRMILAGDGDFTQRLLDIISKLSLHDIVNYIGPVSISEVPALMNQVTMVIMPSLLEPFGLVALEAAHMQRPVIANAAGGLPEIIIDNETGLLVPKNDELALCTAIKKIICDHDFAIKLGKNARKHVLSNFTIQQLVENYEQAYADLLRRFNSNERISECSNRSL